MTGGLLVSYDRETEDLEVSVGKDLANVGMVHDSEGGIARGVRLLYGHGAQGLHVPSPFLCRSEVVQLRRWTRGQGALPDVLADWWCALSPAQQEQLRTHLRALSLPVWLGAWWEAGPGPFPSAPDQLERDDDGPRPVVSSEAGREPR